MSSQFYYRNTAGQESGPYDAEECRRMASVGLLEETGMVREANSETWKLVGSVFPAVATDAPHPPPQGPGPSPAPNPAQTSTPSVQARQPLCTQTNYILLAIIPALFGVVGIHNLIAGYKERGIIQLALSAVSWFLILQGFVTGVTACLGLPLALGLFIWAIAEAVQVKVDANNVAMTS